MDEQRQVEEELKRFATYEANALLFLRAGGTITLTEWERLPPAKQAAAARAGDKFRFALAALAGQAAQGPAQAMAVFSKADGGRREKRQLLTAGVQAMVRDFASVAHGGR